MKFEDGWIIDENNNRCSVAYWGSEEAARKALASLKNCKDCSDCSGCSRCSYCSYCSGCSGCSYCSDCSRCSYCSGCSDCSGCSGCSYCSGKKGTEKPGEVFEFTIPKIESIHQKIYAAASQPDALDMSVPHLCDTTHCRAGWAVHLAGEAGYALQERFNWELAAMLIYRESGAPINPARFYDSEEAALADMKRLAEAEAA